MATESFDDGQDWYLRESKSHPGFYNLHTSWLGTSMRLAVDRDDKTRPHMAQTGDHPEQQWQFESQGNGTWQLTNLHSGTLVLAAELFGGEVYMSDPEASPASQWILDSEPWK